MGSVENDQKRSSIFLLDLWIALPKWFAGFPEAEAKTLQVSRRPTTRFLAWRL